MPGIANDVVWRNRFDDIESEFDDILLPDSGERVDQDEEWCEIVAAGERRRIRFHNYSDIFQISGLYEALFYDQLECCSPSYISNLLKSVAREYGEPIESLRVLDVGAGNGMVGDELHELGVESLTGIDILPTAKEAADRDRPDVYDEYIVCDLTRLPEPLEKELRSRRLNCISSVAALGFGDIPPTAFIKALDLIETRGWIAFNIKEDFLQESDTTGFCRLVRQLSRRRIIQPYAYRRYQHRLSITGRPLYYVAMVARKLCNVPDDMLNGDLVSMGHESSPSVAPV